MYPVEHIKPTNTSITNLKKILQSTVPVQYHQRWS